MGIAAKNVLIGIFVLIAISIIIFILMFLHPSVGDNSKKLKVRFTNIEKVNLGTRVTYAGKPVGEVVSIFELEDARTQRIARNGDVYVYQLELSVDSGVSVYNTDSITLYTSGLLGEKGIEINPEPLQPGEKLVLVENEILYATPARSLEETLQQFEHLAGKMGNVLDNIDKTIEEIRKEEIVAETAKTIRNAREFAENLNKDNKVNDVIDNLLAFSKKINDSMVNVDETLDNLKSASSTTKELINNISEGKGSLGKILVKEDFYLQLKAVLNKAGTVFDDVGNYGILFQNNRRWQRTNAQRKNLMNRLSDPKVFQDYFNNQIQQASESLDEVSTVLNDTPSYSYNLMKNPEYIRCCGKLIRQVDDLNDDIAMYNQQVVDQSSFNIGGQ